MEASMSRLLVGLSVQISRSDGELHLLAITLCRRINATVVDNVQLTVCCLACKSGRVHLASVKSVDTVKSTVMVEWHERNICRGKEVSMC